MHCVHLTFRKLDHKSKSLLKEDIMQSTGPKGWGVYSFAKTNHLSKDFKLYRQPEKKEVCMHNMSKYVYEAYTNTIQLLVKLTDEVIVSNSLAQPRPSRDWLNLGSGDKLYRLLFPRQKWNEDKFDITIITHALSSCIFCLQWRLNIAVVV